MKNLNLIALAAFLATAVAVLLMDKGKSRKIQDVVMSVFSPFIHASASVDRALESGTEINIDPRQLREDNEALQLEVQRLRIISQRYDEMMNENNNLRKLVDYKAASPFKLTSVRAVKRTASTWWNTLIVDKGSLDGLSPDSPVITDVGLIGKVGKVSNHMAEVILLTDERCRVTAYVEGTKEKGILEGERGGTDLRPDLRLKYLTRNATINVGANVYTSGDGGVFPAGLLLGKVKRFENKEISGEAVVEPVVDFLRLDHLFVVAMEKVESVPKAQPIEPAEAVKVDNK